MQTSPCSATLRECQTKQTPRRSNTCPFGEREETTRTSYYMDEDYPARTEIQKRLPERSNHCGSESSTLETNVLSTFNYTLLLVHARKEDDCMEQRTTALTVFWAFLSIQLNMKLTVKNDIITWLPPHSVRHAAESAWFQPRFTSLSKWQYYKVLWQYKRWRSSLTG